MTGYAASGAEIATDAGVFTSQWDMRSVNGRGLDLRFRLPDWLDGLEPALRKLISARVKRGSVSVSLRLTRPDSGGAGRLNPDALDAAIRMARLVEERAEAQGLALTTSRAVDLLALRGVMDSTPDLAAPADLLDALLAQASPLIDAFDANRAAEGKAMTQVIAAQIGAVADLTRQSRRAAEARKGSQEQALKAALSRLQDAAPQIEPGRLEQELALIAVKSDITEELDRLGAHVAAARDLLAQDGPIGRKLDFLMQEFNREANTLCSKSQNPELTRIGLDLKTVIDQMREQVQNLE
tara:strand:+ start:3272 stop:4162 length:891 start_codon:yes stop_codon:yes gene_type:complete